MPERAPLTASRIVDAAARVADQGGLAAVSMRSVGRELGVEAMSLYHHVAGKDALLDALTDWVYARIEPPAEAGPWRDAARRHAASVRDVLVAHPWALSLVDARTTPGPAVLRRYDRMIGCLLRGGFPAPLASSALSVIDAYVYGFALTERNLPFDPAADASASDFAAQADVAPDAFPHLAALVEAITVQGYSFTDEFDVGLDLILDALERRRADA